LTASLSADSTSTTEIAASVAPAPVHVFPLVRAQTASPELGPLLSEQERIFRRRFGRNVASAISTLREALNNDNLDGWLASGPEGDGYALVVPTVATDVLAALWVDSGQYELARTLVSHVQKIAIERGRRLEAQDLGFGEDPLSPILRAQSCASFRRLYLTGPTRHGSRPVAPSWCSFRTFRAGDLVAAASLSVRAFEGVADVRFAASYRSLGGAVERLAVTVDGNSFGPFEPQGSPVAIDAAGRMLGFAVVTRIDSSVAHLAEIVVDPELRGRGLGSLLLTRVLSMARCRGLSEITLCVTADNHRALALYERKGFRLSRSFEAHVIEPGNNGTADGHNLPGDPGWKSSGPYKNEPFQ